MTSDEETRAEETDAVVAAEAIDAAEDVDSGAVETEDAPVEDKGDDVADGAEEPPA